MRDLISRAAAIEAVKDRYYKYDRFAKVEELVWAIEALPSAQPETHDKRTETHACDLISRRAAIDAHYEYCNKHPDAGFPVWSLKILEDLPSAQPDLGKYEYHYDHTDCIWYRPEARNRCPVTCAQYRDGWNDAMNYIFRNGKGYRPYRRGEQYEE